MGNRVEFLENAREEHNIRNVWMQIGKILYWDAVREI